MVKKTIHVADLFCGAGGTSTGLAQAAANLDLNIRLLAVNHWEKAIETHSANHPWADHICNGLDAIKPEKAVPGGVLDLLVASPECTHHSVARGGKPRNDQSRASAWHVLYWCQELYVRRVMLENVPEFINWGPLDRSGRPLASKRGHTFDAFVNALKSLGYRVDWRFLTCANYGDATTRRRFFLQAVRGNKKIIWPEDSHSENPGADLFGETVPWVSARSVIDWNLPGQSIFERKRPLAANTIRRIEAGIKKFWGEWADPFLVVLRNNSTSLPLNSPLPTVTAGGQHLGLIEPFVLGQHSGGAPRSVSNPIPTVCTEARGMSLVQPFLMAVGQTGGTDRIRSVNNPIPTVVSKQEQCVVSPFLVKFYGCGAGACDVRVPLDTVTVKDRFGVVEGEPTRLDIRFRMLQPSELAAAHGFPSDYKFAGNKSEVVKQIGNSVPVNTARALCMAQLSA